MQDENTFERLLKRIGEHAAYVQATGIEGVIAFHFLMLQAQQCCWLTVRANTGQRKHKQQQQQQESQ